MDHDNLNDRFSLLQHLVLGGGGKSSLICDIEREILYELLDILFLSNHNIHKSSRGLCFWASDPLIERFQ